MAIEFLNSVDFNQNQLIAPVIENLGTETLYFITAVLNETNLDNLRNKIIIKTLPNRV